MIQCARCKERFHEHDSSWMFLCEDCGEKDEEEYRDGITHYFESEPHGMTPPGFKRKDDPLRQRPKDKRR